MPRKRFFATAEYMGENIMPTPHTITIMANRKEIDLDTHTIQYVLMKENIAEIHLTDGRVYTTRITLETLEGMLGDSFLKVHRSCIVSVMAIHDITDKVVLNNGETLKYVTRRKKELLAQLREKRRVILARLSADNTLKKADEYHARFASFDDLPIAFTDIEVVVDEAQNAIDWIFRYANEALAKLEKLPLERIIGNRFSNLFPNMDEKWLRSYERAAFYGQTLEVIDYSPEIDTYLDILCFPTIPGHCGCILLNIGQMHFAESKDDARNARLRYIAKLLGQIG